MPSGLVVERGPEGGRARWKSAVALLSLHVARDSRPFQAGIRKARDLGGRESRHPSGSFRLFFRARYGSLLAAGRENRVRDAVGDAQPEAIQGISDARFDGRARSCGYSGAPLYRGMDARVRATAIQRAVVRDFRRGGIGGWMANASPRDRVRGLTSRTRSEFWGSRAFTHHPQGSVAKDR